jgi:hypothetical protein
MPVKRLAKEGEQGSESRSQRRIVGTPVRARARVARQAHAIPFERADATNLSSSASSSTGWPVWIVCILSCWLVDWRSKKGECEKYSSLHRRKEGGEEGDEPWSSNRRAGCGELALSVDGKAQQSVRGDAHIALMERPDGLETRESSSRQG